MAPVIRRAAEDARKVSRAARRDHWIRWVLFHKRLLGMLGADNIPDASEHRDLLLLE